jgi:hypothetical protein
LKRNKLRRKKPMVCNNVMLQNNLPKKSCFQVYDDYDSWKALQNHKNQMKSLYCTHESTCNFNFFFTKILLEWGKEGNV